MKLYTMIFAAAAILAGLLLRQGALIVVGAAVHLLAGLTDLVRAYRDAKLLRSATLQPYSTPSLSARIAEWLGGAITLTGLVLVVASTDIDAGGYAMGGWIIWGGAIACYFTSGIIAQEVGGIPLSMGHGGWAVRRDRKGNLRR